jgi:hypothetical protein
MALLTHFQNDEHYAQMPARVHVLVDKAVESPSHAFENNLVLTDEFGMFLFDYFFRINRRGRSFAFSVSTNGYDATVRFNKPAEPQPDPTDGGMHVNGQARTIPVDPVFQGATVLGIDPGVNNHVTWAGRKASGEFFQGEATAKHYKHVSQMNKSQHWHKNLRAANPEYLAIITGMPTMKTNDLVQLTAAITYRLAHCAWLFAFSRSHGFKKWRFTTFRFSQKAIDAVAKKLVTGEEDMVIGFGDFSVRDGMRYGHSRPPLGRVKRALANRAKQVETRVKIIPIDEYRTSKCCSGCGRVMCKAKASKYVYMGPPNLDPATGRKVWDKIPKVERIYKVLYCNTGCKTFWNRDNNAGRNIGDAVWSVVMGMDWPAHLKRPAAQ